MSEDPSRLCREHVASVEEGHDFVGDTVQVDRAVAVMVTSTR